MDKVKVDNKFSIKKMVVTIIICVLISLGIGMINLFVLKIGNYCEFFAMREISSNYEKGNITQNGVDSLKKYGDEVSYSLDEMKNYIENLQEKEDLKESDIKIEEIFYHQMLDSYTSMDIVSCFDVYISFGILIGVIVYIIFIKKSKGRQLFFELLISIILFIMFIFIKNLCMELIINSIIKDLTGGMYLNFKFLDDISMSNNIYIVYAITICVIIYVLNLIINEIKVRKMNKELKNK